MFVTIEKCDFIKNHAYYVGAALSTYFDDANVLIILRKCLIHKNSVETLAGAIAIYHNKGNLTAIECIISHNTAINLWSNLGAAGGVGIWGRAETIFYSIRN